MFLFSGTNIKKDNIRIFLRKATVELLLLSLSSVLFSLAFPSMISEWGIAPLAFISIIPVFIVVHTSSWKAIVPYGAFYGFITYGIFNYWLSTFHPLAIIIVPTIYATYFVFLFPVLKLVDKLFPKYGYLIQALCWIGYEYLRTKGFLGYSYGIIGYSMSTVLPFIQVASVTGVWGVSFLVILPSAFLGNGLKKGWTQFAEFFRKHRVDSYIYGGLVILNLLFGFLVMTDYSESPQWRVALIQHNADSWKGGLRTYERNFKLLLDLSLEAVKQNPDIVIWSETAFVPGLDWHSRYRTDKDRFALVNDLKEFLSTQNVPYLFGNDDGQLKDKQLPPVLSDGSYNRVDYNAVLLYEGGELRDTYRKVHLVPFTENFPYKESLPGIYKILVDNDYHFWEKGNEYTVFDAAGVKFSTPICFEDAFGYLSRNFVNKGAEVIVNLTNDSWSGALSSQMQHLGIAVFRAIENRRSLIRSANSGMTGIIDPDGRIISILEPFTADFLVGDVPVYTERSTIYTAFGDWFAYASIFIAAVFILLGLLKLIYIRLQLNK
ncbi:MAG: apolipoprotein N-acyltransferase [Spirochaetia bacterium]|jgi:apolipoprotein N-acyltransferase|nr:apolipoprotein N-acyltransferase [Spirochaetia bacterium]